MKVTVCCWDLSGMSLNEHHLLQELDLAFNDLPNYAAIFNDYLNKIESIILD